MKKNSIKTKMIIGFALALSLLSPCSSVTANAATSTGDYTKVYVYTSKPSGYVEGTNLTSSSKYMVVTMKWVNSNGTILETCTSKGVVAKNKYLASRDLHREGGYAFIGASTIKKGTSSTASNLETVSAKKVY